MILPIKTVTFITFWKVCCQHSSRAGYLSQMFNAIQQVLLAFKVDFLAILRQSSSKVLGRLLLFTSFFTSSLRPWLNVEQNVNVRACNC